MSETFALRYPAPDAAADRAEWVVVDALGAGASEVTRGTLADAAAAQGGRRLIVLVPGTEVVLASPSLPSRNAARLARLAPFALEEQIATEVDAMHFAFGRQGADQRVPVAAIERARLARWLADLARAGLSPSAVYPDTLLVPDNPAHVVVVLEGGRTIVRAPGAGPLTLDAEPLGTALTIAGLPPAAGSERGRAAPQLHVLVYANAADWERAAPTLEGLRDSFASLRVQLLADGVLPLLAAGAIGAPPLSLLQGEFAVRQGFGAEWPRWRLAASLVAAFLLLHVATLGVDWWRLRREEARVDAELQTMAGEALPNMHNLARLPSLRAAVESRVRGTRAAVSEGLLGTLGAVAAAVSDAPGTQLQTLSYRNGVTDVTVDAPDVGALDRLQQAAKGRGLDAQLQGATQHERRYQGRLQLRAPGS